MRRILALALMAGIAGPIFAQVPDSSITDQDQTPTVQEQIQVVEGKIDGLNESYLETKTNVDKLVKIKISGYIQTQLRMPAAYDDATDSSLTHSAFGKYQFKVGDFSGGTFADRVSSAFEVRRGRIKVAYETALSTGVAQLDIIPFRSANFLSGVTSTTAPALNGGGVSVKDIYLKFVEPRYKSFGLKMGVFDRPFGFEIGYSSSSRESPERSRAEQTLFPGERDLGISLEYLPADNMPVWAQHLNFKGGFFTGNGINVETDSKRDFIGRLGVTFPLNDLNLAVDGGASLHNGAVLSQNDSVFSVSGTSFAPETDNKNKYIERRYFGGDVQLYYGNTPAIGGTTLRAEGYLGTQPGTKTSSSSPSSNIASSSQIYKRDFLGGYIMLVQNLDPIKSQFVLRYDRFDPNRDLSGTEVSYQTSQTADQLYGTLGIGAVYHWDENVKFVAYLDRVSNEDITDSQGIYSKELDDNVFTFRVQYKF